MDKFEKLFFCFIGVLIFSLVVAVLYSLYGWSNLDRCLDEGYEKIEVRPDLSLYCVGIEGNTKTSVMKLEGK